MGRMTQPVPEQIVVEMLVGNPPHTGSTAQAIVAKVITEKPSSIVAQRDRVPKHVEDAALTALAGLMLYQRRNTSRAGAD